MAKKQQRGRPHLTDDALNELFTGSELPDIDQVDKIVGQITGNQDKGGKGRPVKESAVGRVKYTTALDPELRDKLKIEAVRQGCTPADLIEAILKAYFEKSLSGVI